LYVPSALTSDASQHWDYIMCSWALYDSQFKYLLLPHGPRGTLYPQKLAITSPTSGGRSVGIVRSRTQAMEFSFFFSYFPTKHYQLIS
jgi:hypothetical protein